MDITTNPDMYTPSVNTDGNYIDYVPIITNAYYYQIISLEYIELFNAQSNR